MRTFNLDEQFEAIKHEAAQAVESVFPVEGKLRVIRLDGVEINDKLATDDFAGQNKVRNQQGTWGVPVTATLSLYDKASGKLLDRVNKVKLFTLPKVTPRMSYIVGGNEYQVSNQLRLKSGVYTLRKQNGELKTSVNLAQGKNFDLMFDENKGQFTVSKIAGGQSNIPLYPILIHLGISKQAIEKAWGQQIALANESTDQKIVARATAAFGVREGSLKDYFNKTKLRSDTTEKTLGQGFDRVGGEMLLAASKKLLDVHMGRKEPEDRDSLEYKELHGLEDFIKERLEKNKDALAFKIRRNIDNLKRDKLSQIVNPGAFNSTIESFFTQDDKSATPEQTNPLEMLSGQYKTTIMGSGGIKSAHAITPEMREIHPTHYGFIDAIHTPECYDEETEVFTLSGWKSWKDAERNDLFACRINGVLEFHQARKIHKSFYSGKMYGVKNGKIDYLVTPNHRMFVRPLASKDEAWRIESAEQVHATPRTFCTQHLPYAGLDVDRHPVAKVKGGNAQIHVEYVDINDWCEFVGWFLSEGDVAYDEENSNYRIRISQSEQANPTNCQRIEALLDRLPWNWCQTGDKRCYALVVKDLAARFKDQGYCDTKYIPSELFDAPIEARRRLLEALLLGDGRVNSIRSTGVTYKQQVFCTTSRKLAEGFEKLALGLGHTTTTSVYKDNRETRYLDTYEVRILQRTKRSARKYNHRSKKSDYYTKNYCGMVYCATVPGSLLLVRRKDGIALWLGNSDRIGANLHLPIGAVKDGKELKSLMIDKTGKSVAITPAQAFSAYVAFPGQTGKIVKAMYQGKTLEIPASQVDYTSPSSRALFSWSTNMIPFLPTDQGNRSMMAAKMLEQAISLKHREAPLVQVDAGPLGTAEQVLGKSSAVMAPDDGVIKKVTPDYLILKTSAGEQKIGLYEHYALNRKSYLHHEPAVKEGDRVKKGQLLADSNFTKDGVLALGTNLKAAFLPYKGLNFEDGIVITESAADKLTSAHIHKKSIDLDDKTITSLGTFRSQYPSTLNSNNAAKLDQDGVVKKGQTVHHGDIVIAALQKREPVAGLAIVQKKLADRPKDVSVQWTQDDDGTVIDVHKSTGSITVLIRTEEKAKIGDKLAGRHGNKGIITRIIQDADAPHNAKGEPIDIMLNPHGIISRINIGQVYESAAGKAAKKTGRTHVVKNFSGEDYLETTRKTLKDAGVDDKEELFDPKSGKSLGRVHVGNPYMLKLFKLSQGNFSVRQGGPGHAYDLNMQPLKGGGEESSKSLDLLTMYSMLSHGGRANLREMSTIKSNQNDEFWTALKAGQMLPAPKTPFVYDKFLAYLKGAGINTVKQGSRMTLAPLTDREVLKMSKGEVKKPVFFRAKDMEPLKDGFLDPVKFGGFKGTGWGHIELKEPIVNPVFESAIRKITNLGGKFDDIMAGKLHVSKDGSFNKEGKGLTGGAAIEKILKDIDVDHEIKVLTSKSKTAKAAVLDDINKKLRYLQALKKFDLKPAEAYIRRSIPVVPPIYRPTYPLPDGHTTNSDVAWIYQNLGVLNHLSKTAVMDLLPEEDKAVLRADIYEHARGLSGLTDLNIKGRPRAGFISAIKGGAEGQPKEGFFISKMLSKQQDYVGRGTIIPEPELGVDEVALPEQMAWKLFEPFIIRELKQFGKTPNQALVEIKDKTDLARKALQIVMKSRKVLLNRAPSLHKFSIMAFRPQITAGTAIKIPPLVVKGFNADFDGDEQLTTIWTCLTDEAVIDLTLRTSPEFVRSRKMTARFKETIPVRLGNELFVFNLEDFPHGDLIAEKEGRKGPIEFYHALPGYSVLAYDESNGSVAWQPVSGWSRHKDRLIEIVTLASGRQIITDDDERAVYGVETGKLTLTRHTPEEAKKTGMLVPRSQTLELPEDGDFLTANVGSDSIPVGFDLGYFIGAAASNGWVEHVGNKSTGRIALAQTNRESAGHFSAVVKRLFSKDTYEYHEDKSSSRYGEVLKTYLNSKDVAAALEDWIGSGSRNKHLPAFFLSAKADFRKGLFAGLMDNDGGVGISNGKAKPQLMANYSSVSIRLVQEVQILAKSLGIRGRITASNTPAGKDFWMLSFSNVDIKRWGGDGMAHSEKLARINSIDNIEDSSVTAKNDIIPMSFELAHTLLKLIGAPRNGSPQRKSLYAVIHKAKTSGTVSRQSALIIPDWVDPQELEKLPEFELFWKIVQNKSVTWDKVEAYERTIIRETGYDLTVPGFETFMNVDGVILSNTMTVHAPITDEANDEAEKMLPSRNLYQPGTGKLMILPSQEAIMGLYYLSKTAAGRSQLNKILDKKHAVDSTLNKSASTTLLTKLSKDLDSNQFAKTLQALKSAGEKQAYDRGFTVGLEDLDLIRKERDVAVNAVAPLARRARNDAELKVVTTEANRQVDAAMAKKLKDTNNPFFDMVESGARGDASNLRSIIASPMFVTDARGKTIPSVIRKSYAEGLGIGDYWTSMYGARRGMMDRAIQTSLPGAFSKDVMASTIDMVVSAKDCGTKKGIDMRVEDPDIVDRFRADNGQLIDSQEANRLKKSGTKTVLVRSPLTCLQAKGVCARCYGLDEHGKIPDVGENVGAKSGQTISEPLIQLVMNTFHSGGTAGTGADVGGYRRIDQLLKLPKIVAGAATLAPTTGKVESIERGLAGGYDVVVDGIKSHVVQGRNLKVTKGQTVQAGDPLSDGVIKPQDLVKHKGMQTAQEYVVNELHRAYGDQGVKIKKSIFETVVRSLGNTTVALNSPHGSDVMAGDIVPYTVAQHYNENLVETLPTDQAVGHVLHKTIGPVKAGTEITGKEIRLFKTLGIHDVVVKREALRHAPILKSVNSLPLLKKDWMAALGYRNLAKALTEGAGQGWTTDMEDYHPVPAFAHGATFGRGKDGKY